MLRPPAPHGGEGAVDSPESPQSPRSGGVYPREFIGRNSHGQRFIWEEWIPHAHAPKTPTSNDTTTWNAQNREPRRRLRRKHARERAERRREHTCTTGSDAQHQTTWTSGSISGYEMRTTGKNRIRTHYWQEQRKAKGKRRQRALDDRELAKRAVLAKPFESGDGRIGRRSPSRQNAVARKEGGTQETIGGRHGARQGQ